MNAGKICPRSFLKSHFFTRHQLFLKMKAITFSIMMLLANLVFAQRGINAIYRENKRAGSENIHFTLPRPVFWIGSLFPKHRDERKLIRSVKQLRILVIEEGSPISALETRKMLKKAENAGLEPLLEVRDGSTHVSILGRERKGKLRNLAIIVREDDEFVLLSLKTRLKIDDLSKLFERLSKEKKLEKLPIKIPEKTKVDQA